MMPGDTEWGRGGPIFIQEWQIDQIKSALGDVLREATQRMRKEIASALNVPEEEVFIAQTSLLKFGHPPSMPAPLTTIGTIPNDPRITLSLGEEFMEQLPFLAHLVEEMERDERGE